MSYIDRINESIDHVDKEIKRLQNIKRAFKKDKQKYCPHLNLMARMPKLPRLDSYLAAGDTISYEKVKITTYCKDCGKVFKNGY